MTVFPPLFQFMSAVNWLQAALVGRRKRIEYSHVEKRLFEVATEKAGSGNINSGVIISQSTAMKKPFAGDGLERRLYSNVMTNLSEKVPN